MKIKQKIKTLVLGALLLAVGVFSFTPVTTYAAGESCGGVSTAIIKCGQAGGEDAPIKETGVWGILLLAINIMTGLVALAAVAGIVYGAIMYTTAGGSVEQTKKAMGIITNVVIGIVAYALMYAGLNFLIPGGIFT